MKTSALESPTFLIGAERSGTTLLRLMLSHHPQIAWCNEFEYAIDQVRDNGQFPEVSHYLEWLKTHRIFQATGFEVSPDLTYEELVQSFLQQKQDQEQKPVVGATVHRHFDRLLAIWPNARFIHIVRDPRDVARSCISMGWAGNVWTGSQRWVEAEECWEALKQNLPVDRYVEISYEDLIRNAQTVLTQLANFLGVDYDPAMLEYNQDTTYEKPNSSLLNQWRRKLGDRDVQLVECQVGDFLIQRGYEASGLPTIQLTGSQIRSLKLQDWWARANFRLQRYGAVLFALNYITSRLPVRAWRDKVQLQINQIDLQYIK
ncbi:sulfotransferase [Synechocystis salina LEGE 06155]|nr:sulfotransferase [Synechocystis salina LEGE 06155]